MDRLDIVGMVVPQRSSHSSWANVVRDDVGVVGELSFAKGADPILCRNLFVHQLPHLGVRAELSISARVFGIVNTPNSHLARSSFLGNGFPSAACQRTVDWAQLISTESHGFLQQKVEFSMERRWIAENWDTAIKAGLPVTGGVPNSQMA
jgi:hypothetical protein